MHHIKRKQNKKVYNIFQCKLQYTTLHNNYNYTSTTFHYTTLHSTTLPYTTLHSITLDYTQLHSITLNYTQLHYTTLITLHYTTLHQATLHYNTLQAKEKIMRKLCLRCFSGWYRCFKKSRLNHAYRAFLHGTAIIAALIQLMCSSFPSGNNTTTGGSNRQTAGRHQRQSGSWQ